MVCDYFTENQLQYFLNQPCNFPPESPSPPAFSSATDGTLAT